MVIKGCVQVDITPQAELEPGAARSVGQRLTHWAPTLAAK